MRRDALWTISATLAGALFQLGQVAVAAHLLSPRDLGVLAMIMVIAPIIQALQEMGMSSYCVHLGEQPATTNATLFWVSSALGISAALLAAAISSPLAQFYQMPELVNALLLLSLNFVLIGLAAQYQAHLVRCFRLRALAQVELVGRVISFAITCALLMANPDPIAIVWGFLTYSLLRLIGTAMLAEQNWHPTLSFDSAIARAALRYGLYQMGAQIINQLRTQADQLIVGKALGTELLGVYSLAKQLASYPLRLLQPLISRFALPHFAARQSNADALASTYLSAVRRTSWFSCAFYAPLALLSPWVVDLLYGAHNAAVAPLVTLLCLFGMLRPLGVAAAALAQATGRSDLEFRWNAIAGALSVMTMAAVIFLNSLEAVAVLTSALQIVLTALSYHFLVRSCSTVSFNAFITAITPSVVLLVASVLIGLGSLFNH